MPKKWDSDSTSSDKLLLLFATLLFNKRAYSLAELSSPGVLNASRPTVLRLLRQLERSQIGVLVHEKRGRESWYRLEHGVVPSFSVNPDAVARLCLCRDFVLHLLPQKLKNETAMAIGHLGAMVKNGSCANCVSIAGNLTKGRIDYDPFQEIFTTLEKAIRDKRICKVLYLPSQNHEPREHLFAPGRFLSYHETVYVEGWLLQENNPCQRKYTDPAMFALQRFKSCALADYEGVVLPALPVQQSGFLGLVEDEPFEARVWFAAQVATYVAERTWSKNQTIATSEDGSIILTLGIANYWEGVSWVLGFGENAVVLEPEWFAKEVRKSLRHTLQKYSKGGMAFAEEENAATSDEDI